MTQHERNVTDLAHHSGYTEVDIEKLMDYTRMDIRETQEFVEYAKRQNREKLCDYELDRYDEIRELIRMRKFVGRYQDLRRKQERYFSFKEQKTLKECKSMERSIDDEAKLLLKQGIFDWKTVPNQ